MGFAVIMSSPARLNPLNRILAFLLRLLPFNARLLLLAVAGVLTALLVSVFDDSVQLLEENLGSLLDPALG